MEGVYIPDAKPRPAILVSSLRPAGRQSVTCGHEMGHHVFEHGEQWDEIVEQRTEARRFDPKEYQADLFSAALHMPKIAVNHALNRRGLDARTCPAESVYALAKYFGVGYGTLVTHMARTLNIIDSDRADELLRHQPKDIRARLLGKTCPDDLIVADVHWTDRAIDVQVGDMIVLPAGTGIEGRCISIIEESSTRSLVKAEMPGIGRAANDSLGWAAYVRVMRKDYVGRAPLRFDEEVDDVE